jgi:hypothetical protein
VQSSHNQKQNSEGATSQPQADQRGIKVSPLVVDIEGHKDTAPEAAAKQHEKDKRDSIDTWTLRSAEITAGATFVLMLAGIGGVIAAVKTLRAISAQGAFLELQTKILKAQFYQCLYLDNWEVKKPKPEALRPQTLRVRVNLMNPSEFPITLEKGSIHLENAYNAICHVALRTFLPPKASHTIEFIVGISEEQERYFDEGNTLRFPVKGSFSHVDRIDAREIIQLIEGVLSCGHWGTHFNWMIHMNPGYAEEEAQGEQKAN